MSSVPELYAREALGAITSERFGVFTKSQAQAILGMKLASPDLSMPFFVVIDPTGGGMSKLVRTLAQQCFGCLI